MDDADAQNASGNASVEVVVDQIADLAGLKGMEVQGAVDGHLYGLILLMGGHPPITGLGFRSPLVAGDHHD